MTLAEDLVRAAAQAMIGPVYGPATKRKATLAVVAVLDTLAAKPDARLWGGEGEPITYTKTLRTLADEVRRG